MRNRVLCRIRRIGATLNFSVRSTIGTRKRDNVTHITHGAFRKARRHVSFLPPVPLLALMDCEDTRCKAPLTQVVARVQRGCSRPRAAMPVSHLTSAAAGASVH